MHPQEVPPAMKAAGIDVVAILALLQRAGPAAVVLWNAFQQLVELYTAKSGTAAAALKAGCCPNEDLCACHDEAVKAQLASLSALLKCKCACQPAE